MPKSVLLVEDETLLRETLAELLAEEGFEVVEAPNGERARDLLCDRAFDLVLTDIRMPEMDGLDLLRNAMRLAPQTPVVIMTAFGTVESAVQAMREGAADYLLKPVQFEDMLVRINRAIEVGELRRERRTATEQLAESGTFHNLIGESPNMLKLFETVRTLSTVRSSVLIGGESGTGKELFARAIHYNGVTRAKPFVAVNCGAIPENLIESELFGHRRGAFTGAVRDREGYFEAASGGTLFLDEISTLPINVQSSLLRVLEERVVVPVGDTKPRPVDVRIIAATNQDLRELCERGLFREDLLYRLDVVRITLPPLRQRRLDIPLLIHHFLDRFSREMNKHPLGVSDAAMRAMLNHEWRGNVRELENVIERAVIFADGRLIDLEDLPFETQGGDDNGEDLKRAMQQYERQHIIHSLRRHRYDKAETAANLGIGVSSLYRKMDELDIPKNIQELDEAAGRR
ncbi:MAG: sigma-54-dependent Fis family transcriptional regulator [Phycisphaeraceae bacterium]|nr:sigma-54-dependent Fis family transcriptional regulator [Phycisphaeraceae bacterium]MCB9848651.1 sigma-54-dependent Fis family transcriptional regulator [Phycisphaeraceae bacterium]